LIKRAIAGLPVPAENSASSFLHSTVGLALDIPNDGYRLLHGAPEMSPQDRWALKLAHHLNASVIKRSDVIEIGFRAHDPRWAREFLTRLIDQYMDYHARLSHDPQAERFFGRQAGLLQAQLNGAEENLRQLQVKTGITSLPDQKQALVNRLSQLQLEYSQNSAQLASTRQQVAALEQELGRTPQRISKEQRSVQNLALAQLKDEVMKLQSERAELLTRYQPNSRRISEIDARLAAAQKILDRENHLEVQEVSTDLNPVWVAIDQSLKQSQANASALAASHDALEKQVEATRGQLTELVNNGVAIEQLQRKVETAKEAYLSYVRKGEEARAAQGLNSSQILNVALAQAPNEPLQPVAPILWLNLLAGLVLGAVAGLCAAWWEECSDPRLYSAFSVEQASGVSTIAVLHNQG